MKPSANEEDYILVDVVWASFILGTNVRDSDATSTIPKIIDAIFPGQAGDWVTQV